MAANKSKENRELQVLNDRFAEYIEKIKNQMSNQQGPELISIHDLMEEKMRELWSQVDSEKKTTQELERYKRRFNEEEKRRKDAEKKVDDLIMGKITAELDCEFQKKRNGLLKQEIKYLKEIYEKNIRELQSQRQQDVTDGPRDELKKAIQKIREQENRITLVKQKKKMEDMEKQFKKMMGNLTGYEEAVNNKLDLKSEIENYEKLLEEMKKRVDLEEGPRQKEPTKEAPKTPGAGENKGSKENPMTQSTPDIRT